MASQLAYFHQRNYILLTHQSVYLRKQHDHFALAIRGSLRLFSRPDDLYEDEESEIDHVLGIRFDLPAVY